MSNHIFTFFREEVVIHPSPRPICVKKIVKVIQTQTIILSLLIMITKK